jgi:hypothetical protein
LRKKENKNGLERSEKGIMIVKRKDAGGRT